MWLNDTLGWFPLFADGSGSITGGGTIFTAGIVLAVMILPVITAVTREVFIQTPALTDRSCTRSRRHALGSCAHHGHPVR